jgi:hypothetical protein
MTEIAIDFETYSEANLKQTGLSRYAMDPTTEILCMSYSIDGGRVKSWRPDKPFPADFQKALDDKALVWGWNVPFEIQIWRYAMTSGQSLVCGPSCRGNICQQLNNVYGKRPRYQISGESGWTWSWSRI